MPDTPNLETMRAAIAEIVDDIECGVLAWHDIGERATNSLAQLRAALRLLTTDTESPDAFATQFLMTPARIRIAARRVEDAYPDTASYLRDLAKVFDIEIARLAATAEQSSAVAAPAAQGEAFTPNFERMYMNAVLELADISDALGVPDDEALAYNGPAGLIARIRCLQSAAAASTGVPAGHALVPLEPTEAMKDAAYVQPGFAEMWRAMIAAAPALPASGTVQPSADDAPDTGQAVREAWRAAITLGNNICAQESDDENGNDGDVGWISGTARCAERIREYAEPSDEALRVMLSENDATAAIAALAAPPADARDAGNYNEGSVTVFVADLRAVLDGNLAAAEEALPYAGGSIDFIESRGGDESDDPADRIAYHLFYTLHAAERLRALLPEIPADRAMGGE